MERLITNQEVQGLKSGEDDVEMIALWIILGSVGVLVLIGAVLVIQDMVWYRKSSLGDGKK